MDKGRCTNAYQELGISLTLPSNFDDFDDVPQKVARLVHEASESLKGWEDLMENQKDEKELKAKRILCSRATKYMTEAMLREIDSDGDLLEYFQDMKELLNEQSTE